MEKVFCWECGKQISKNAVICPNCGANQNIDSIKISPQTKEKIIEKPVIKKHTHTPTKIINEKRVITKHYNFSFNFNGKPISKLFSKTGLLILNILKWIFIFIFIITAIGLFLNPSGKTNIIGGVIFVLMSLTLLPYTEVLLNKIKINLNLKIKTIIIIIFVILFITLVNI